MTKKKSKGIIHEIFSKDNIDYIIAELGGALSGYVVATLATIYFKNSGFGNEFNAIATFLAMHTAFWAGNMIAHRIAYSYLFKGQPYPKQYIYELLKANSGALLITGVLQILLHYFLLETSFVPYYLAPLVGYSIPGLFGTIFRQIKNYKSGLFGLKENPKE
ncbi:MAG: hypothetical protein KKF46_07935 [Nanoarchaeota archaeon]|nr:hypothetical protein [Nanoarchaeota archaeon]MBU1322258.1 hypothetical protein [Nanoarchaeota archaeon]MBU1598238.1 hypothetical protein [Nanoarchaeota archaeon]MBU2441991.1 hypothetical protein [Nanoarchaeota archaeon]